jgi:predicted pyridoxine 5'-phosphate oxidase superfamily flavin-nucleotide-binding protein
MITTAAQLDECLGSIPGAVNLKVIDHLDAEAMRWLGASTIAFVAGAHAEGTAVTLAGAGPGFARAPTPSRLSLSRDHVDDLTVLRAGCGVGLLFLVPGVGETLRVNGRVAAIASDELAVDVEEVFLHCAKALLRSSFWLASPGADAPHAAHAFLQAARFVAIATANAEGHADLSPKGDPAGSMLRVSDAGVSYAERPGNRRADSLRNMLTQPRVSALALIPGCSTVATVRGRARLLSDDVACAPHVVAGKRPKLVTRMEDVTTTLRESAALRRAQPWPLRTTEHGIDPAAVFVAHVKLNKDRGMAAALMRKVVNTKLMGLSLAHDYKNRLY